MDSFEWNKIAGAVLFALLVAFGLSIFSELIFETEAPESPGYVVAIATEEGAEGGEAGAPAEQPIGVLLAAADPAAGEGSARKCGACHTFNAGEANKVGPNLFDIVMRPIAGHEGYAYSDAMQAFAEQEGTWDYEHLNTYLADPKGVVPGTKMAFAGLRDDSERANVIAYLHELSDDPKPLPPAEAAAPAADAEAAEAAPEAAEAAAPAEGEADAAAAPEPAAAEAPPAEAPAAPEPAQAEAPAPEQPTEQAAAPTEAPAEQQTAQAETPAAPEAPAAAEPPAAAEAPAEAAPAAPASGFAALVAAADVAKGEAFARRCIACHTFEEGGANRVGPNLWGVVNRPVASVAGLRLFRRHGGVFGGRREGLGLRYARRLSGESKGRGSGHQDGLSGRHERGRPGECRRLSSLTRRRAGAAPRPIGIPRPRIPPDFRRAVPLTFLSCGAAPLCRYNNAMTISDGLPASC